MSALGNSYGIATDYLSDEPGSMLDYLWLSSGSGEQAFGCAGWGCAQTITSDNIFRELNKAGLPWKVYADSLPSIGFMGDSSGNYVKRHNPAAWYSDVVNDAAQQKNMVPFTQFAGDLAAHRLPNYSLIIPDLQHDAHTKRGLVIRERRRGERVPARQTVTVSLGNGGHQVSAFSANLSSGGVFSYCDRFIAVESEVALILDLPPDITKAGSCRVWCNAKVVRIDRQLTEGKFGIALAFTSVQPLPEA